MRACKIGSAPPATNARFKRVRRKAEAKPGDKLGQQNTSFMVYFPTRKGESRMERLRHYAHRAMAALLETDPEVVLWTTDTLPLAFTVSGRELSFTPNFRVDLRDGTILAVRLVAAGHLGDARRLERYGAVRKAYLAEGMSFVVRSEEDVLADPRLAAAREILWHRPWEPPAAMLAKVAAMAGNPPRTLGALHAALGGADETWPLVISLIARGCVEIGTAVKVAPSTRVLACRMGRYA